MTDDLIARLEAAKEGGRELDAEVYNACPEEGRIAVQLPMEQWSGRFDDGWRTKYRDREDKYPEQLDCYTKSIDAALTLVPEGRWWVLNSGVQSGSALASISVGNEWGVHKGNAATPAIALCIAALKARKESRDA